MKGKVEAGIYAFFGAIIGVLLFGFGIYSIYKNTINEEDEEDIPAHVILVFVAVGIMIVLSSQLRFYAIRKNPSLAKFEAVF